MCMTKQFNSGCQCYPCDSFKQRKVCKYIIIERDLNYIGTQTYQNLLIKIKNKDNKSWRAMAKLMKKYKHYLIITCSLI